MKRGARGRIRRDWSDHSRLMREGENEREHIAQFTADDCRAFDRLPSDVQVVVRETGYLADEALRLVRRCGPHEAIRIIRDDYRAIMKQSYQAFAR